MTKGYELTPELAEKIIATGLEPELQRLYTILRECYNTHTPEEIGQVFGYIRAEFVLAAEDKSA